MIGQRRREDERGVSAIELVLYMPLLMLVIVLAVQFSLVYLAQSAASSAAREAARVARVTGDTEQGVRRGNEFAADLGGGTLRDIEVTVEVVDGTSMRATVSGRANQLLPYEIAPRVSESSEGRIEQFEQDTP